MKKKGKIIRNLPLGENHHQHFANHPFFSYIYHFLVTIPNITGSFYLGRSSPAISLTPNPFPAFPLPPTEVYI